MTRIANTRVMRRRSNGGGMMAVVIGLTAGVLFGMGINHWFGVEALAHDFACAHLTGITEIPGCLD